MSGKGKRRKANKQAQGSVSGGSRRHPRPAEPAPASPPPAPAAASGDLWGLSADRMGAALLLICLVAAAAVSWWFQRSVPRSFDAPKALALKLGGGLSLLLWAGWGLLGKGRSRRSLGLFAAPVFAFAAVAVASSYLSLDVSTSVHGVYERQFGLHGVIACLGLYVGVASGLKGRRGAVAVFGALAVLGGVVGSYAVLQSYGWDPFLFFRKPHTKVFSFTGNATFAGNALALVFPISSMLAAVATAASIRPGERPRPVQLGAWAGGLLGGLGLLLLPGVMGAGVGPYKLGIGAMIFGLAAAASHGYSGEAQPGPRWARALTAGLLSALAVSIAAGLVYTRTRGAWVGTAVSLGLGLALLPRLFVDRPSYRRLQAGALGLLAGAALLGLGFLSQAEALCAPGSRCLIAVNTVRSIPTAFQSQVRPGTGQGTRPYLWSESPRVLLHHDQTLNRLYQDQDAMAAQLRPNLLKATGLQLPAAPTQARGWDRAWRRAKVWLLGIGVETYRYAFMSHKSERLEALDPMTNHDNPHNNYLYVLASFGVLGLAAYLWLLARLLRAAYRHFDPTLDRGCAAQGPAASSTAEPEGASPADRAQRAAQAGAPQASATEVAQDPGADRAGREAPAALRPRWERALAFGVVTSFFSYAVYSIAGFDSVICSVFFYVLLGATSGLIRPNDADPSPPPLLDGLAAALRPGRPLGPKARRALALGIGLLLPLSAHAMYGGLENHTADVQLGESYRQRSFEGQRQAILAAVRAAPHESMYKQRLGDLYEGQARLLLKEARRAQNYAQTQASGPELTTYLARIRQAQDRAQEKLQLATQAYTAALEHAWAPENLYLKLYQAHLSAGDITEAERALDRCLQHSPHLAPILADRAALLTELGRTEEARQVCAHARRIQPQDRSVRTHCAPYKP